MKLVALIFCLFRQLCLPAKSAPLFFGMLPWIRGASSPVRRMKLPITGMCLTMVFTGDFHLDLVI